jgi:hypothetical protein
MMRESDCGCLPVREEARKGRVLEMITERDIGMANRSQRTSVAEVNALLAATCVPREPGAADTCLEKGTQCER